MRPPKRNLLASSSSTCSGLKSPKRPAASTRCVSVTVSDAPNVSPTLVSSNHFPVSIVASHPAELQPGRVRHPARIPRRIPDDHDFHLPDAGDALDLAPD